MKRLNSVIVLMLAVVFVGGCAELQKGDEEATGGGVIGGSKEGSATTQGIAPGSEFYGEETKGLSGAGRGDLSSAPWNDPQSPLSDRVVYFDFDSSEVPREYHALISLHAEYLASHTELPVTLEGHADERGSREYNIALSEQRANAVAKIMNLQGVEDLQIRVVGYGEEKPAEFGHDENSWRLNRRVEITYPN